MVNFKNILRESRLNSPPCLSRLNGIGGDESRQ
jgi:hypothetical protein